MPTLKYAQSDPSFPMSLGSGLALEPGGLGCVPHWSTACWQGGLTVIHTLGISASVQWDNHSSHAWVVMQREEVGVC